MWGRGLEQGCPRGVGAMDRSRRALWPQVKAAGKDGLMCESQLVKMWPEAMLLFQGLVAAGSWLTRDEHSGSKPGIQKLTLQG